MSNTPDKKAIFADIAKRHLFIETLEIRRSDSLDFHSCAIWCIESALENAYQAGYEAGQNHIT